VDIFAVNKIPFIIPLSFKIYFTMVTRLDNHKIGTIFKAIKLICAFYLRCGFRVVELYMDSKFGAILPLLVDWKEAPEPNLTATNKHIPQETNPCGEGACTSHQAWHAIRIAPPVDANQPSP
jgi:hypothetical protein